MNTMGSTPRSTKKLDALLQEPPKHNLVSHFVLGEIIDHISLIHDDFPEVDIPLLKDHLWEIRNKNVKPEGHLRGFLKVFEKTKVFEDAFEELDDTMKVQLRTFMAGGGEHVVMAAGRMGNAFFLPPSPAVKHHFREMAKDVDEKVGELFHIKGHSNGVNETNGIALREVEKVHEQVRKIQEKVDKVHEKVGQILHHDDHPNNVNGNANGIPIREVEMVHEQVRKIQEKVDKVHERVGQILHHDDHSNDINGSAADQEAFDEFAVKPYVANGHVEHVKEGLNNLFHHEKHDSTASSNTTNCSALDEFEVEPVTHEHIEQDTSSTSADDFAVKPVTHEHIEKDASNTSADQFAAKLFTHEQIAADISSTAGFPRIFENHAETKTMEVYDNKEFQNWGQSVRNTPRWTFVPRTVLGLQNLVKWAKIHDFRVRCGGYRHSWSRTFSQEKQILVSLLNLEEVTKLPDAMSIEPEYIDPENELKIIHFAAPPGVVASKDKALVRVGVSVTNEQFRRWAVENDKWTLPVDVILVE